MNQESEIEQASLGVLDGAPWWGEAGTYSNLVSFSFCFWPLVSDLCFI